MSDMIRILFLCTGNSCRSQMAEGLCRHLRGDIIMPFSAGIYKRGIDPLAVKVMREIDIDISGQKSKTIQELRSKEFDYVVTLCDNAKESCPLFSAKTGLIHRGFEDPPKLAAEAANEEEALAHYRRIRNEINNFILTLPDALEV